jgi:hypothetical protein
MRKLDIIFVAAILAVMATISFPFTVFHIFNCCGRNDAKRFMGFIGNYVEKTILRWEQK